MRRTRWYLPPLVIALYALYYFEPVGFELELSSIFITISTFLFAVLAGFFISRQSARYSELRSVVSEFDGNMSALYRSFTSFEGAGEKAGEIIAAHYRAIIENRRWDWHFTRKSTTITDLNRLFGGLDVKTGAEQATAIGMVSSLDALQIERKRMVSLQVERIPLLERGLITILASALVLSLLLVPSAGHLGAFLKAIFGAIVVLVVLLLNELDSLKLFEGTLGENSAKDVLRIIEGTR